MTQRSEKLSSSQLDRKPIEVRNQQNKFQVRIEQASLDSKEELAAAHHHVSKPTLNLVEQRPHVPNIIVQDSKEMMLSKYGRAMLQDN